MNCIILYAQNYLNNTLLSLENIQVKYKWKNEKKNYSCNHIIALLVVFTIIYGTDLPHTGTDYEKKTKTVLMLV